MEDRLRGLWPHHDTPPFRRPYHDSICKLRRENKDLLPHAFHQVLELAARARTRVLQVGDITVAIDGTKILSNASKHSAVSYGHAVNQMMLAEEQIAELLQKGRERRQHPLRPISGPKRRFVAAATCERLAGDDSTKWAT